MFEMERLCDGNPFRYVAQHLLKKHNLFEKCEVRTDIHALTVAQYYVCLSVCRYPPPDLVVFWSRLRRVTITMVTRITMLVTVLMWHRLFTISCRLQGSRYNQAYTLKGSLDLATQLNRIE